MLKNGKMAVLLAIAPMATSGCEEQVATTPLPEELRALQADQVLFDIVTHVTVDGIREARIQADTAYIWQDSTSVALRTVNLIMYDDTGEERARVTSRTGLMNDDTQHMVARGEAVLVMADRRIESAEIHYEPQRDRIWSDSTTVMTMTEGGRVVEGSAFLSDANFENIFIQNQRTRSGGGP